MSDTPRKKRWSSWAGFRFGGGEDHAEDVMPTPPDDKHDRRSNPGRRSSDKPEGPPQKKAMYVRRQLREDEDTGMIEHAAKGKRARSKSPREMHAPWVDGGPGSDEEQTSPGVRIGEEGPNFVELIDELDRIASFQDICNKLTARSLAAVKKGRIHRSRYAIPDALIERLRLRLGRTHDQETHPGFTKPE